MPSHLYQGERFVEGMRSLIGEEVNVVLETVDKQTALFSIDVKSVTRSCANGEPVLLGVAVALHTADLKRIRDAINRIIGEAYHEDA